MNIWSEKDRVICVVARSKFYTVGGVYKVVKQGGEWGVIGTDGVFDPFKRALSEFQKYEVPLLPKPEDIEL